MYMFAPSGNGNGLLVEFQTSADVRPRVRETVVRVRVRHATLGTVVRVSPNVQQLHGMLPFNPRRLRAVEVGGAVRRGQDFIFVEVLAWEIIALA